jgi:3-deoxy-manno-octulosonate cytidylyltransferase (CMP-KDO synthetase)
MTTAFTVVIPSRYASTRLPGKPLLAIAGKPMVQHVWEQASKAAPAAWWSPPTTRASSRPARLWRRSGADPRRPQLRHRPPGRSRGTAGPGADAIVVNVQGDEPLIPPVIDQVAANLAAHTEARMATLAEPIEDVETLFNPNVVKVVSDINGLALTFSRATLPWARDAFAKSRDVLPEGVPYRRHIGIYAYRAGFLQDFVSWGPCWLENTERWSSCVPCGMACIHVADALEAPPAGVDTPEDLERVRRLLEA